MSNAVVRQHSSDLQRCRSPWAEMTQQNRNNCSDSTIGGDNPGLEFDRRLAQVGAERMRIAETAGEVAGLTSLIPNGQQAEVEPVVSRPRVEEGASGSSSGARDP